jgi:hypothetical protein
LVLGFAATTGATVATTSITFGEIWVVCVGDAVSIGVGLLTVVRVIRERISCIRSAVTVGVGRIGVRTTGVFLCVGQAIVVRVAIGVTTRSRVEAIGHFPTIREAVTIGVGLIHVSSLLLFFCISQPVAVPVGPTIGGVEWVGAFADSDGCRHQNQ